MSPSAIYDPAAEVDRLRAALAEIHRRAVLDTASTAEIACVARAALEGK